MLVTDFISVPMVMEDVHARIAGDGGIGLLADAAYRRGEELALGPTPSIAAVVDFSIGEPVIGSHTVIFPIGWHATGTSGLFPHMDAELVLSPMGDTTHIEFRGVYTPPFGGIGVILDRVAMHRLAEATVRNFLERLVESIGVKIPES